MKMKYLLRLALLLSFILPLQSCEKSRQDDVERRSMLIYICGNNNLSYHASDCMSQLQKGYIPSDKSKDKEVLLVFYHVPDSAPTLCRIYKSAEGQICEELISIYAENLNSATTEALSNVLADAERAYPSQKHGLVLWSHSTGFLPVGYYNDPVESSQYWETFDTYDPYASLVKAEDNSRSFGYQDGIEMDIIQLAETLNCHYEFIIFDCCLMGGIEVAYQFKNRCDYIMFSPTEIMAKGFPYETMMEQVFHNANRVEAFTSICRNYYNYYQSQTGSDQSATVTLIDNSRLTPIADICKTIFAEHRSDILKLDRNKIQPFFRYSKHWFYDMGDFIQNIATEQEYNIFCSALDNAVIYKAATERFLTIDIKNYSGLSIYIPKPEYEYLNTYYKGLAWNHATSLVE